MQDMCGASSRIGQIFPHLHREKMMVALVLTKESAEGGPYSGERVWQNAGACFSVLDITDSLSNRPGREGAYQT